MRITRPFRRPSRVRVVDGQVVEVEGDDFLREAGTLSRVCLFAHWAVDSQVSRSVDTLIRALQRDGFAVALISTAQGEGPLAWPVERPANLTVLRRPNAGYDFGSWATGLDAYPQVASADEVLFVNDSLAGPFAPMDDLLARFHRSGADVWGATDTTQFTHHLQSYFVGYKQQVLLERPLADFWRGICVEASRDDVIHRYELGLGRLLHREAFSIAAAYPYMTVVGEGRNPTIHGWRALLDLGFPFVKRELLRKPTAAPDGFDAPREIARRFGANVKDWL